MALTIFPVAAGWISLGTEINQVKRRGVTFIIGPGMIKHSDTANSVQRYCANAKSNLKSEPQKGKTALTRQFALSSRLEIDHHGLKSNKRATLGATSAAQY